MNPSDLNIETIAVHAGSTAEPTGDIAPAIHLSTTFERDADGSYPGGHQYTRSSNTTRAALESAMAALEGGAAAVAFSSGMAAAAAVLQSLSPGDHIVVPSDSYYGVRHLLAEHFSRWGLEWTAVDMARPDMLGAAIRPTTRLVWIETPSNPMLKVTDLAAVVAEARRVGAVTLCDNTLPTPVLQRPFEQGVDLVLHATTKYIGGHSDVLGGVVIAREKGELIDRIRSVQTSAGAVPAPFDCWLVLRGMRTLPLRMRAHSANALQVARFLASRPDVELVRYPGLEDDPGHEVASRQMSGFGGLLSFEVAGGWDRAIAVAARVRMISRATSFGGVHSLIEHRASIEAIPGAIPGGLLRLSVGIEHADDIIADLRSALG